MNIMKLNDIARQLIGSDPAALVTINRDGSPQVSVVWVTVQSTADGGDELVTAHLQEHQKIRNIMRRHTMWRRSCCEVQVRCALGATQSTSTGAPHFLEAQPQRSHGVMQP